VSEDMTDMLQADDDIALLNESIDAYQIVEAIEDF
jgi:hypothetical protein